MLGDLLLIVKVRELQVIEPDLKSGSFDPEPTTNHYSPQDQIRIWDFIYSIFLHFS